MPGLCFALLASLRGQQLPGSSATLAHAISKPVAETVSRFLLQLPRGMALA